MESSSSKTNAFFLICMLFVSSSVTPILGCGTCDQHPPTKRKPKSPKGPITLPPVPPITVPPVIGKPPVVDLPPIGKPPVTLPPITKPPVDIPPITLPVPVPPVLPLPPVIGGGGGGGGGKGKPCPPKAKDKCPIDVLKLGACVDLLGGLVHIGLGDPAVNQCCPVLEGLAGVEAAVCLCTTLKIKALNLNIYVPIALQLLISCGKTPPPGYTCSL